MGKILKNDEVELCKHFSVKITNYSMAKSFGLLCGVETTASSEKVLPGSLKKGFSGEPLGS